MIKRILSISAIFFGLFFISNAQVDVKVIQNNLRQCDTAGLLAMPITLINTGSVPIINGAPILVSFKINGGTIFTESIDFTANFNPGDTVTMHFTTPYRFNQFITYNCMFAIDYLADADVNNDTVYFTSTFNAFPGYGAHSNDTAVCLGSPATLMMELTGNGPWSIAFVIGPDTAFDLPVNASVIETEMTLDSTMTFTLLYVTDSNGCTTTIGQSITITINPYPEVFIGTDTTLCASAGLLLDAGNPSASYTWWDGPGSQTNTADTADWDGALGSQTAWVDVNLEGCIHRDSIIINWIICSGSVEENETPGVALYPNPSIGTFTIEFTGIIGTVTCDILNHLGQHVYSETFVNIEEHSQRECFPGELPKGIYFVKLHNQNQHLVHRLVIE
jgi:hypothetical protein